MGSALDKISVAETVARAYCDDVYTELAGMRMKILMLTDDLAEAYGDEGPVFMSFQRHLTELADQIEWKLQILSYACPFYWKGSKENVESVVSVSQPEITTDTDISGGYLGGGF